MYIGLQSAITANKRKTVLFLLLFPVFFFAVLFVLFGGIMVAQGIPFQEAIMAAHQRIGSVLLVLGPIMIIRGVIAFFFQRQLIFSFTGARPVTRKTHEELYNIVENLCISRGLQMPQIGILDDGSLNAFALGRKPENAWIVFSQGLVNKLNKQELEAVAAHELTHIMNRDTLLMIVLVIVIGIIATLGELLFRLGIRMKGGKKNPGPIIALLGVALLLLGYIIFPLLRLAISRKREYLADAGSVELTKDAHAMASALQKISADSTIEQIKQPTIGAMCIENPFQESNYWFRTLLSTHPPIEKRVQQLHSFG